MTLLKKLLKAFYAAAAVLLALIAAIPAGLALFFFVLLVDADGKEGANGAR